MQRSSFTTGSRGESGIPDTAPFGWLPTDNDGHSFRIPHRLYSLHNSHIRTRHDQSVRTIFQPPSGGVWHRSDKPRYILHIPDGNTRVRKTFQAASTFLSKKKDARHHWGKPIHTTDRPCNAKRNCATLALPPVLSAPYAPESSSPLSRPTRRLLSFPAPLSKNRPSTMKPQPENCGGHYPVPPFPEPLGLRRTDITYGSLRAFVYAVHTSHATAVIYLMFLNMDARRLAITFTQIAIHTL